jgi:hypothetical protein
MIWDTYLEVDLVRLIFQHSRVKIRQADLLWRELGLDLLASLVRAGC